MLRFTARAFALNLVPSLSSFVYRGLRFAGAEGAEGLDPKWIVAGLSLLLQVLSPEVTKLCGGATDWYNHNDLVKMCKNAYNVAYEDVATGEASPLSPEVRSLCAEIVAELVGKFNHENR